MSGVATIGEIAVDLRSGFASGEDDPSGVVQFRMNNVERSGAINWDKLRRVPSAKARKDLIVEEGDILFNATNSPELVGKTALFAGFSEPVTFSNHFVRIRSNRAIAEPAYLARWLQREFERGRFESMCRSWVNQASITRDQLASLEFPLPPLGEQRRIAAILDKADALRRTRKRTLELLDGLTHSVFLEMFGSVVAAPSVNVRRSLPVLPAKWEWRRLTDVARLATGHTPDRKQDAYWNGSIPWLSLGDIRALDGTIALSTAECVTEAGIENSSSVLLPTGTVCFSRTASVGFTTIMGRPMGTSQDFVNWVCTSSILPLYLLWALITARRELLSLASGSTHRTIYFPTVEQFQVLLPPLVLQERFAELATKVANQRAKVDRPSAVSDELFASLQSQAFSGLL